VWRVKLERLHIFPDILLWPRWEVDIISDRMLVHE
jgi:Uri superfamily endonuclease